ncbi:Nramp family divalent metal transporter [Spongiactinospora sp. TRM90649]|uniref:Nramp family divalent metal transporter n=1 Tax=Spongiactinospora sp. TRM90649 TaxID=3031114 RepID=UPI0023F955E3|nr:Nramp family divalent metal transporter [Spongiactinospora sp. TRM90649]MDF5756946.1 Nramp family divalent metal transporter [Spongiactinospora sp. TRM90649]
MTTLTLHRPLVFAGPAFLVAVGYVDPGNWGTDIAAGSQYGYRLLWVLVAANGVALFLQYLAAKLGIATGSHLAALLGTRLSRPARLGVLAVVTAILIATEVAEFLGVVIALHLLLGGPMVLSVLIGAALVLGMLTVARGNRALERGIGLLLAVVAAVYVMGIWLSAPGAEPLSGLAPSLPPGSALIAVSLMGATIMPHNLFLHSGVVGWNTDGGLDRLEDRSAALRTAMVCGAVALNAALLLNAAIMIVAAATGDGEVPSGMTEAAGALAPALGPMAVTGFGLGLLAAGLASTTTSGVAGQFMIEGLTRLRPPLLLRRAVALVPAVLLLASGVGEVEALLVSQLVLGLALPIVVLVLIRLTSSTEVMGAMANGPATRRAAYAVLTLVTAANVGLIADLLLS